MKFNVISLLIFLKNYVYVTDLLTDIILTD